MNDTSIKTAIAYDGEEIDVSDMPEITDFTGWVKNPHVGKFIKNGKFIAEIEHGGYKEIVEYDTNTGQKTVLQLIVTGNNISLEDKRISYDDIPEITDFSKARKNPFAGRCRNGYTVIIEHDGYNEIRKYDFSIIPRTAKGDHIPFEVTIEKRN